MAFEPLNTDERLETPVKRERDMDSAMLLGCSGFVTESLLSYALAVWPWFVVDAMHQIPKLALAMALGGIPALVVGAIGCRKFGLPAACGFVGGGLSTAIFMYLRLQQVVAVRGNYQFPQPEYPNLWVWLVPGAWLMVVVLAVAVLLPRSEWPGQE